MTIIDIFSEFVGYIPLFTKPMVFMENQSAHKGVVDSKLLGVAKGWYEKGYFHSPKQDFILNNPAKDMSKGGFVKAQLGKMASIQLRSMVI